MTQKGIPFSWMKIGLILLVAGIAALTGGFEEWEQVWPEVAEVIEPEIGGVPLAEGEVVVARVIDGDTVELENGQRVRYIGMDTPELENEACWAQKASLRNSELVLGKAVRLEKDVSETDRYGRLLRYVWIGEEMVNEVLVREGLAVVSTYPPDVKYQERLLAAEREAGEKGRGVWGSGECED